MKKILGPRILKTGVAVSLSLLITQLIGINSSFAGVVSLIGVKQTTKRSLHYGITLFLGSIVSIFIGIFVGLYLGSGPIAFGFATIIAIPFLVAFGFAEGLVLALVVMYHIIEAPPITIDQFWFISFHELILVFIGISISVMVNLAAPQRFEKNIQEGINSFYLQLSNYLHQVSLALQTPCNSIKVLSAEEYLAKINTIKRLSENADLGRENSITQQERLQYDQLIFKLRSLRGLLDILEAVAIESRRLSCSYIYSEQIAKVLELLAKIQANPEKTTISSYHRIFKLMSKLEQYFDNSPLPASREEFVNRSALHHIFLSLKDYIDSLFVLKEPQEYLS